MTLSGELLKAVPTLSPLLGVHPNLIRAHIKYKVGDIGRYCFMLEKSKTKKLCNQYYVMLSDVPKILHRDLTQEELQQIRNGGLK